MPVMLPVLSVRPASTVVTVIVLSLLPLLLVQLLDGPQLLLQLHPAVLEPDLDLSLRQAKCVGNFDPASSRQVVVEVELLLQLEGLEPRVCLSTATSWATIRTLKTKRR